eukprot:TRINITY_DN2363_c0_g1_i2.p1 TRINITY_DN2363_c0_g1~~TRINITY_DN2363_c0_g1_i2.p1  ORF type:complete len:1377 (-),score=340.43 TRINITY_DN2363_c0_g1_i2:184-4314(-)
MTTYNVQVHLIQAMNLIPGPKNFCIPMASIKCFGEEQFTTKSDEKTLTPLWDQMFVFEASGIGDLREHKVVVSVVDTNTWFQNDMVGQYSFELAEVYSMKSHEMYRKWCVLHDPESSDVGITPKGWLKLSILCKKDTDPFPAHDDDDPFADPATDGAASLQDAILKPPGLQTGGYFLHLFVHKAKDLPRMDLIGGVDPMVGLAFAGGRMVKTTVKKNSFHPVWEEWLVVPVSQPAVSDTLEVSLWDYDMLSSDEMISTFNFSMRDVISAGGMGPTWLHFYSHPPNDDDLGVDLVSVMEKFRRQGMDEPERAFYAGSLLVEAILEKTDRVIGGNPALQPQATKQEPPMTDYVLRFGVSQVAQIDQGIFDNVRVQVKWGREVRTSKPMYVDENTQQCCFFELMEDITMRLPEDIAQLPAVVVTLRKGVGDGKRVAYKKFWPFTDLPQIRAPQDDPDGLFQPTWHLLDRDWRIGEDEYVPPYLQFMCGVSRQDDGLVPTASANKMVKPPVSRWMLRAHVFLARGLVAADPTGASDPVLEVRCGSAACTTRMRRQTLSPQWFESVECTAVLPSDPTKHLSACPLIQLIMYDCDDDASEDLPSQIIGSGDVVVTEDMFLSGLVLDYPATIPPPQWVPLFTQVKGSRVSAQEAGAAGAADDDDEIGGDESASLLPAGKVLVCFQIMHPSVATTPSARIGSPHWSLVPEVRPRRAVELECVAIRDIVAPATMSCSGRVFNPFLRLRVDDASGHVFEIKSQPCNTPAAASPNPLCVIRLPINEPVNPLFMPTLLLELWHMPEGPSKPARMIGRLERPLEDLLAGWADEAAGGDTNGDPVAEVRAVLEHSGVAADVVEDAVDAGDGLVCDLGAPEDVAEAAGMEAAAAAADEVDVGAVVVPMAEGKELEHSPVAQFSKPIEQELTDIPYKRYRFLRGCAPQFNEFASIFDRQPRPPQVVGFFKGTIRVVDVPAEVESAAVEAVGPPPEATQPGFSAERVLEWQSKVKLKMKQLLNMPDEVAALEGRLRMHYAPREYILRVYAYRAYYLVPPKDVGNKANPTLILKAPMSSDQTYPRVDNPTPPWPSCRGTLSPPWRHTFTDIGPLSIPGSGPLKLEVWDVQQRMLLPDVWSLMGTTKLDLDDRVFSQWLMSQPYANTPTETRPLWVPTARSPQGLVEMFVQVLSVDEARQYPPLNIKGPGPEDFELHAIVWGCRNVQFPPGKIVAKEDTAGCLCCKEDTINIRVSMQAKWKFPEGEGEAPQAQTDIHYRSDDQKAEFNWRCVVPVTLPCKFHFLQLNVWDEPSLLPIDPTAIAEATFNMKSFFEKAHKNPNAPTIVCRDEPKKGAAVVGGNLAKRGLARRNKNRGEWLKLSHPKASDGDTTAEVR